MELYQEPPPESTQELEDSNMSSPGPSPITCQSPSQPEPPPSPKYIVTELFMPYTCTSPLSCRHNTYKLQLLEIPSQPWRKHLAYSLPTDPKHSRSPSEPVSASQCTCLSDGGYAVSDVLPMMAHPYSSWSNSGSPSLSRPTTVYGSSNATTMYLR